jgi:tetratricopeptide (TPR) repeat protein
MPYTPMQLADAFIQTGELQDALDALDQQLKSNPADDEARRLRIQVLMRIPGDANLQAATMDFQKLSSMTAHDAISHYEVLTKLGEGEAAFQVLEGAWENDHTDRLAEVFIQCLLSRGDGGYALDVSGSMPKTWRWLNWDGDAAVVLADHHLALDYYSQALNDLQQRMNGTENAFTANIKASILLKRGEMRQQIGQLVEADTDYQAAEAIIPSDPMIPFKRGLLALLRGDLQQAENLCYAAWGASSETLRDEMRQALHKHEHYAPLIALLDESSA